jgi:hypothetical protein
MAIRTYKQTTRAPGPARAPSISLAVAGDTSGARQLGNAVQSVAMTIETADQQREMNDARLEMTEGLGALSMELGEDQDFATMNDRYSSRLDDLKSSVLGRVTRPATQAQMEGEFARGRVGAEANIMRRKSSLEGGSARVTAGRLIREVANFIPTAGSDAEAEDAFGRGVAAIDGLLAAGYVDPEEAEQMRLTLDADISTGLVLRDMNLDPAKTAAALSEPGAYGLDEVPRQKYLATATRAAAARARSTKTQLEKQVAAARGVLVRGGTVSPEDLTALREDVRGTEYEAQLAASIEASGQLGNFAAAGPEDRAAFIDEVRARGISIDDATLSSAFLATIESVNTALTAAETADEKAIGQRVKSAIIALGDGRDVADIKAVRSAAAGTAFEGDLNIAEMRAKFVTGYKKADLKTQKRLLADARANGVLSATRTFDEAFLETLEQSNAAAITAVKADPIQYAIDNLVEGAAPLDLGDQDSVFARMALVQEMTGEYGAAPMILSKEERKAFKKVANEGTPEDQLSLVLSVTQGFGRGSEAFFAEIDGIDPVVRRAGDLVFETGDDEVAGIILAGRKAMEAGDELRTPGLDALAVFETTLDGVLRSVPGRREEVIEAARAYYAQKAPGRVTIDDLEGQTELLTEAVQRVLGAVRVNGVTYGGVQDVNGKRVKLPSALDSASVKRMFDGADLKHWQTGSISGSAPFEGDAEALPENAVLQWVRGSIYRVGTPSRRGEIEWYQDPTVDNGFFYLDLNKMAVNFAERPPSEKDPVVLSRQAYPGGGF